MQFLVSLSLILPALAAPIASPQTEAVTDEFAGGILGSGPIPGLLGGGKLAIRHGAEPSHGSKEEKDTLSVGVNANVAARAALGPGFDFDIDDVLFGGPARRTKKRSPQDELEMLQQVTNLVSSKKRNAHGGPPGQKHEQEKENDEGLISVKVDALSRRAEHGNQHGGHESAHKEEEGGLAAIEAKIEALTVRELLSIGANVKAEVDVNAKADANADVGGEDEKKPSYAPSHGPSHGSGYGGHAMTRGVEFDDECEFGFEEECEISIAARGAADSDEGLAKVAVTAGA